MKHRISLWLLLFGLYLGIYNGNLAICEDGKTTPVMVLPYKAALFPEEDQKRLKDGIPFENNHELAQLLEDFMS